MNRISRLAMISCEQAALMTAKRSMSTLSPFEHIKYGIHLKICKVCEDYANQTKLIDKAIDTLLVQKQRQNLQLSEEQRARILKILNP